MMVHPIHTVLVIILMETISTSVGLHVHGNDELDCFLARS
jgi:hypothetical protein